MKKVYEVIARNGKSKFFVAKSKNQVLDFWVSEKPKRILIRKDISIEEVKFHL